MYLLILTCIFCEMCTQLKSPCVKVAIGRRFGIEEPQLMKIVRATLHTHTEWFKLQMCKDQFDGLLWIKSLKEHGGPLLGDAASKTTTETCTQGSSPVTISSSNTRVQEDGSSSNQISSSDTGCDENAILKVMVRSHLLIYEGCLLSH